MPAPVHFGNGSQIDNVGAISPAWAASHVAGDRGMLFCQTNNQNIDETTDVFVALAMVGNGTPGAVGATALTVFWGDATQSSMPPAATTDSGDHNSGHVEVYRGVLNSRPPVIMGTRIGTGTAVTFPGGTTDTNDALILHVLAHAIDTGGPKVSAQANASLTGVAEVFDNSSNTGNGGGVSTFVGTKATAGDFGEGSATLSASSNWVAITIVLYSLPAPIVVVPPEPEVASLDTPDLLEVWRRVMDPGYTVPLENEDGGRGLDVVAGTAAMLARVSAAVLASVQAMYLKEHSRQLAPPASGPVVATGNLTITRNIVVGGAVPLLDGDLVTAHFLGVNGEDEDAPVFSVVGSASIPAGTTGPTVVPVKCTRPGFQGNVPPGTPALFPARRGGTFSVVSYAAGLVTVDAALGDSFTVAMTGMFWRFTNGANLGQPARRLTFVSATTATVDATGLVTQGTGTGEVVDFDDVGDFDLVFVDGTSGGRSGELDHLAKEITESGRAVGEEDADFRARVTTLPEAVSPNAIIRAIAAVLDPHGIPFQFMEVFDDGVGFVYSGDTGPTTTDSAYDDPFAYRNGLFYLGGGATLYAIGFIVVINGLALPAEPDRTAILSALTATIVASKGGGVPWAVAIEPPVT